MILMEKPKVNCIYYEICQNRDKKCDICILNSELHISNYLSIKKDDEKTLRFI